MLAVIFRLGFFGPNIGPRRACKDRQLSMGDWNVMQVSQLSPFGRFAISEGNLSFCLLRNDNLHEKQPYILFSSLSSICYAARIFIL
jgi:hypothetical protein